MRRQKHLKQLDTPRLGARYKWVGWLCRDARGNWTVLTPQGMEFVQDSVDAEETAPGRETSNSLLVVYPSSADGSPEIEAIGHVSDGKPVLSSDVKEEALKEGRPVFFPSRE